VPDGFTVKIDMPEPCNVEAVDNPLPVKRLPNDYTSLPGAVKSWNDYEDWLTYDNSEFRAGENFTECWGDVDKLKEKFGEVWLININYAERIRPESKAERYCFGFDFAIAAANDIQRRKIKRLADNYRNIGCNGDWNCTKAIEAIIPLMLELKSYPFVEGHFS
jgi:hypothetical protein